MTRELLITLRGDRITFECPQKGKRVECANLAGITTENKLLSLGDTPEQVATTNYPARWEKAKEGVRFVPILSIETMDNDITAAALQYFAITLYAQTTFFHLMFPTICRIDFPNYDQIPPHIRRSFEVSVQFSTDFNELWINGEQVSYPLWRERAARLLNFVMTFPWVLTVFLAIPFAIIAPAGDLSLALRALSLGIAFLIIILGAAGSTACEWLWVVLMRKFIPRPLIRLMRGTKEGYILFPKRFRALVDRMLADEHSPPTAGSI
jgi:hypothetical protein